MKIAQILLVGISIIASVVNVLAIPRDIRVEWQSQDNASIAGFRLYYELNAACETNSPTVTSMDCTVDAPDGEAWFTMTSFLQDGTESPHSTLYSYIFSSLLKALFSANPLGGESPLLTGFDASSSTGNITSYDWMFGDGDIGTGKTTTHTFLSAGSYTVTLKTIDDIGANDQDSLSVVVTSPATVITPPLAVISSSSTLGRAPLQVELDGSNSSDSDGTIISYAWDMGDGGTASGAQLTYTYSNAGTFTTTLTVTDDGGSTNSVSTPVVVQPAEGVNTPPVAIIASSARVGKRPLSVTFNAGNSKDTDGSVTAYSWNFGDGKTSSRRSVKHNFTKVGIYTVTLTVTDDKGAVSLPAKVTVTVKDPNIEEAEPLINIIPIINYLLLHPVQGI